MNIRFKRSGFRYSGIDGAGSSENSGSDERERNQSGSLSCCVRKVEIMVEMDSPLQDFFIWREKMCVRFLQGKKHP